MLSRFLVAYKLFRINVIYCITISTSNCEKGYRYSEIFQNMTRILLLSEQHMIYPSIFSNYYRPKGFYLLSIDVKIFVRMGFFNKNVFRLCSYSKFYGNQDNRKIPSATSSQHYFLLFPILGYKRGEQNSPFSRQGNCLKFISGPPVLLQGCRSWEGGGRRGAWPPRF